MRHLLEGGFSRITTLWHPHSNIILSLFSIPLVWKCAAKMLKIGLQIKISCPKKFLSRIFCMEKLLRREVTIFPEKKKALIFYSKCIEPTPDSKKSLPGVQTFEYSQHICKNPKLKMFGLSPLPMKKSRFKKHFGRLIFNYEPIIKILGLKEY